MTVPRKFSDEQEARIAAAYRGGEGVLPIAARLGCYEQVVRSALRRQGVQIRRKPLAIRGPGRDAIVRLYQDGLTLNEIAARLGWTQVTVNAAIRESGITRRGVRRTYSADHAFFGRGPSEARDYVIGFLAADGCVSDRGAVTVGVQSRDRVILEQIRGMLGYTGPIYDRVTPSDMTADGVQRTATLSITSPRMAADLAKFGVMPRKTYSLEAKGVEASRHFWRGFWDGDGCITKHKGGEPGCSVGSASRRLMDQLAAFASRQFGEPSALPRLRVPSKSSRFAREADHWILQYGGYRTACLLQSLYDNCTIALPRKQEKAMWAVFWATSCNRLRLLTHEDARLIRALHVGWGMSHVDIGKLFDASPLAVLKIVHRRTFITSRPG